MAGLFITFEGGEGSGKSTQVRLLKEALEDAGKSCITTREPGGVASAERIRNLLVKGKADDWDPLSETLMFYAARLEHMQKLITPALKENKVVICDRFADSTRVYQGVGKGVSMDFIEQLHSLTLKGFTPHLTFVLDIDPEAGLRRAADRNDNETRFESMALEFHQQIRKGFLDISDNEPERCVVIDAGGTMGDIHNQIKAALNKRFGLVL